MIQLERYKNALQKISNYAIKPTGETELQRIERLKSIADKALFIANICSNEMSVCCTKEQQGNEDLADVSGCLCDGCNVRKPFEHRCHGEGCNCDNPVCMERQGRITHQELMEIVNKWLNNR